MNIEIANRLVYFRKKNNLSQESLAEKLGISRQAISKWERAESSPDTDNLILLAKIYQVSLDELLSTEEEIIEPTDTVSTNPEESNEEAPKPKFTGIHLKSDDGEIYIGRDGIYAADDQKNSSVHLKDTAHVIIDGEKYTFKEARKKWGYKHHHSASFPIIMLSIIVFLSVGIFYNIWHPTWLIFLLIPLSRGLKTAWQRKSWFSLPYPIMITTLYLILGFSYNIWHPAWILFLTIPLYYSLIHYFQQKKEEVNKADL